jgi:arginine exporter protein ArgO
MVTKVMGTLLFVVGFFLITLATLSVLEMIQQRGAFERVLLYVGGLILCILGYIMARDKPPSTIV